MSEPYLAPHKRGEPLILRPMPNGGWVVSKNPDFPGMGADDLGAFGSARDMLTALSNGLLNPETDEG